MLQVTFLTILTIQGRLDILGNFFIRFLKELNQHRQDCFFVTPWNSKSSLGLEPTDFFFFCCCGDEF